MNLLLRMLIVTIGAFYRKRLHPFETSVIALHVWPNDLDLQMHMNNGRFLSIMDLGRLDLIVRTGLWRVARQRKWYPLVGTAFVDYRRPLNVFERFELRTKLLGWDDRWIYIEQQFVRENYAVARATLKTMIRSPQGAVTPQEVAEAMGLPVESPGLPDHAALMAQTGRGKELL